MKTLRTRNDIFAAVNCRLVEIEEGNHEPDEEAVDHMITAIAYFIRVTEGIIRHEGPVPGENGIRNPYERPSPQATYTRKTS